MNAILFPGLGEKKRRSQRSFLLELIVFVAHANAEAFTLAVGNPHSDSIYTSFTSVLCSLSMLRVSPATYQLIHEECQALLEALMAFPSSGAFGLKDHRAFMSLSPVYLHFCYIKSKETKHTVFYGIMESRVPVLCKHNPAHTSLFD